MKKKITFFLIFISIKSISQIYQPMLENKLEWHITSCYNGCITDIYYTDGDTIYNNFTYRILNGYHYVSKTFWIREDTNQRKIYMSFINNFQRKEVLLYDFSLEKNDTIEVFNPVSPFNPSPGFFIVDSIKYETSVNNNILKKLYLSSLSNTVVESPVWIEGIGSLSIINAPGGTPDVNGVGKLSCFFRKNQLSYFQSDSIISCSNITGKTYDETYNSNDKIIRVFDILGRETKLVNNKVLYILYESGLVKKRFIKY
tara:strand:+ start:4061 stop:4831 length:771 start_codon:yes stop_codon:yes gene_type:complete